MFFARFGKAFLACSVTGTCCTVVLASNEEKNTVKWAYPSPYDEEERRFVDANAYRSKQYVWDLNGLLKRWQASEEEETWPWVWTQRNPNGPHFVFVGVDSRTLNACEAACEASENHNLTLVVRSLEDLEEKGYDPADFYAHRCAIIESRPSQIDFDHKILMLEDERIMCYDTLTVVG